MANPIVQGMLQSVFNLLIEFGWALVIFFLIAADRFQARTYTEEIAARAYLRYQGLLRENNDSGDGSDGAGRAFQYIVVPEEFQQ